MIRRLTSEHRRHIISARELETHQQVLTHVYDACVIGSGRTSGNVKKSAEILCCPRHTFYRKLKKLGIKVERDH